MAMTAITITLACGHLTTGTLPPTLQLSDTLPCWACNNHPRTIMSFRPMNDGWHFACTQCRYARSYGQAPITTLTAATKHSLKKHHRVYVFVDDIIVRTITSTAPTLSLDGTPPF